MIRTSGQNGGTDMSRETDNHSRPISGALAISVLALSAAGRGETGEDPSVRLSPDEIIAIAYDRDEHRAVLVAATERMSKRHPANGFSTPPLELLLVPLAEDGLVFSQARIVGELPQADRTEVLIKAAIRGDMLYCVYRTAWPAGWQLSFAAVCLTEPKTGKGKTAHKTAKLRLADGKEVEVPVCRTRMPQNLRLKYAKKDGGRRVDNPSPIALYADHSGALCVFGLDGEGCTFTAVSRDEGKTWITVKVDIPAMPILLR